MRIACISDIHANLEALTRALEIIEGKAVDAIFCLGDVVGYGGDPSACVDLVRSQCAGVVLGNHDAAVALDRGLEYLPPDGIDAALFSRSQISEAQRAYLAELPLQIEEYGCTFVHATPAKPELWRRLNSFMLVQEQFQHFNTDVCFIGHTHIPGVASDKIGALKVRKGNRYLINVGSVGQPRDNNPRLSFGIFDTETFEYELVRETYDVASAAAKIRAAGLPERLASRLEVGE